MKRSGIDENDADVSASSSPPTADITELASCWYRPSIIHKHNGNMEPRPAAAAERKNPLPDWISYLLLLLFSSFPPPSKQQQQQQQPKSTKDFSSAHCNVWWDCLYYCRCSVLRQSLLQDCFTTIISLSLSLSSAGSCIMGRTSLGRRRAYKSRHLFRHNMASIYISYIINIYSYILYPCSLSQLVSAVYDGCNDELWPAHISASNYRKTFQTPV